MLLTRKWPTDWTDLQHWIGPVLHWLAGARGMTLAAARRGRAKTKTEETRMLEIMKILLKRSRFGSGGSNEELTIIFIGSLYSQ